MADPTVFNWSLLDDQGLKNNTDIFVAYDGATMTANDLVAAWGAYGLALDVITDAQIIGGSITIPLPLPGGAFKAAPAVGNNVNQVMNLNFNNDFNSYATSILIPAYKENTLTPTRVPDLADANLAAYIALMLSGYSLLTNVSFPNSRDLHDLNALRDAFLTVRKVRNQKHKTIVTP